MLREQERDVTKYWRKNEIRIALFGLENETNAEDDMPFRVMGYDGAAYRDQIQYTIDEEGVRHKSLTRYPVVTLVLYFGYRKHWNKARTLHEALGERLTKELAPYVPDYRLNIFEIAWLTDEQVAGFQSDFRYVADYFVQKRKTGDYTGSHEEMRHVREVLELLSALAADRRFVEAAIQTDENRKEVRTMCDALDKIEMRGQKRGEEIGQKRGEEIGETRGTEKTLYSLVHDGLLSLAVGAARANMTEAVFSANMEKMFA